MRIRIAQRGEMFYDHRKASLYIPVSIFFFSSCKKKEEYLSKYLSYVSYCVYRFDTKTNMSGVWMFEGYDQESVLFPRTPIQCREVFLGMKEYDSIYYSFIFSRIYQDLPGFLREVVCQYFIEGYDFVSREITIPESGSEPPHPVEVTEYCVYEDEVAEDQCFFEEHLPVTPVK